MPNSPVLLMNTATLNECTFLICEKQELTAQKVLHEMIVSYVKNKIICLQF